MTSHNHLAQIFETILAIPGMNQVVKIDLRLSRKNVLILSKVIEQGLQHWGEQDTYFSMMPPEALQELQQVPMDLLKKAELTEMNDKLKKLQ